MPLNHSLIVGRRTVGRKTIGQCPQCAANGADKSQQHLVVYEDGRFGCVVDSSSEHSKAIFALIGFGGSGDSVDPAPPPEPRVEIPPVWNQDCLARLIKDHGYWEGRGISAATVEPFRGGVATVGQLKNRYVFPMFNVEGEIIGFDGRWTLPTPPPAPPGGKGKPWKILGPSSSFIWGGIDEAQSAGRAVLVESIGDSLMLREHGVPESLCLFGANLSNALLGHLISTSPREIIVSTNRDQPRTINGCATYPGQEAAIRIQRTLNRFFDEGVVRIVHPPKGVKDWGEASGDQIQAAFAQQAQESEPESDIEA